MPRRLTDSAWLRLAHYYTGDWDLRSFFANFGVTPIEADFILASLPENFEPSRVLLALEFLKQYPMSYAAHGRWGLSERTYRTYLWETLELIEKRFRQVSACVFSAST